MDTTNRVKELLKAAKAVPDLVTKEELLQVSKAIHDELKSKFSKDLEDITKSLVQDLTKSFYQEMEKRLKRQEDEYLDRLAYMKELYENHLCQTKSLLERLSEVKVNIPEHKPIRKTITYDSYNRPHTIVESIDD